MKRLSDLGERKAIHLISSILSKGEEFVGIGDDCAAISFGDDLLLISTDMINEKTHIPKSMNPYQIGWFIVAINISDIAAKGGKPIGMVLSLGLPNDTSESFLTEMMKGADSCAKKHGFSIIGGDTKENPTVTISGTIFGILKKQSFMPRKGCKPGDKVVITGNLGKAAAGFLAIENNIQEKKILKGLIEPNPRLSEGIALADEKIVTSCMDISDGLSSSLYQLSELNNVGFEIDKEKIPISSSLLNLSKTLDFDVFKHVLHFGGDYELLFTISPEKLEKVTYLFKRLGLSIADIGCVTEEKKMVIFENGKKNVLENSGYEHFKNFIF